MKGKEMMNMEKHTQACLLGRVLGGMLVLAMVAALFPTAVRASEYEDDAAASTYQEKAHVDVEEEPVTEEPIDRSDDSGADNPGDETPTPDHGETGSDNQAGGDSQGDTDEQPDREQDTSTGPEPDHKDEERPSTGGAEDLTAGIQAPDTTALLGDDSFDLLEGVQATDCTGEPILAIEVADQGGFDVRVAGDYSVTYRSIDPENGAEYEAVRTVTVEQLPGEGAFAAGTPVRDFEALQSAVAGASGETTITVAEGFALTATLTIPAQAQITLAGGEADITLTYGGGRHILNHGKLTLQSIVLDGEQAGGGLDNRGTLTLLEGAVIQNCLGTAQVTSSNGGGVLNTGSLVLNGGQVSGNQASHGGGVYNTGSFELITGSVSNNHAGSNSFGGGVYSSNSVQLRGGSISGNTANSNGAGVFVREGSFTMTGGKISSNQAKGTGAGLTLNSGSAVMWGGEITGNTAANNGGGVNLFNGTFRMEGGAISYNTSTSSTSTFGGGGVSIHSGTEFIMTKGSIHHNAANQGGGVKANGGRFAMSGGDIYENEARANGGGVYCANSSSFTMGKGSIRANRVTGTSASSLKGYGGGVYLDGGATLAMTGGSIEANSAVKDGGGVLVYANPSAFAMSNGILRGNHSNTYGGGIAVRAGGSGTVTLSGTNEISGNSAGYSGGGIYNPFAGTLTIGGNTDIIANEADSGGGIYNFGAITLSGTTTFKNNVATTQGGGIYTNSHLSIPGAVTFRENRSAQGGGVYGNFASVVLGRGVRFQENSATLSGGAVHAHSGALTVAEGAVLTGNRSSEHGGALYLSNTTAHITGSSFSQNNAAGNGGAIHTDDLGTLELTGSSFSANVAGNGGFGIKEGDKALYARQVQSTTTNYGAYVYNNHDVNYTGDDPLDQYWTVTFHANGGVYGDSSDRYVSPTLYREGEAVRSEELTPTRSGFAFTGKWFTEPACINEWQFQTGVVGAQNLVLYAGWVIDQPQSSLHTLTFHANGGSFARGGEQLDGGQYAQGEYLSSSLAEIPARSGYLFTGWYREASCQTLWDFEADSMPGAHLYLYAGWDVVTGGGGNGGGSGGNGNGSTSLSRGGGGAGFTIAEPEIPLGEVGIIQVIDVEETPLGELPKTGSTRGRFSGAPGAWSLGTPVATGAAFGSGRKKRCVWAAGCR